MLFAVRYFFRILLLFQRLWKLQIVIRSCFDFFLEMLVVQSNDSSDEIDVSNNVDEMSFKAQYEQIHSRSSSLA